MTYEIEKLTGGPLAVNTYILSAPGRDDCVVVDPGVPFAQLEEGLAGRRAAAVILTHAHFDHTGALRALHEKFPDVPIYVTAQDTDETLNMSQGNLVYTDTFLDGDEISMPPLTFRVLATPGHTRGSSCLICGDTIFSGDTLFEGCCGRTDLPGGDGAQMLAALKRLAELPDDYHVLPGHGGDTTLERERRTNYYMREAMRV